jgi:hypothetical protein
MSTKHFYHITLLHPFLISSPLPLVPGPLTGPVLPSFLYFWKNIFILFFSFLPSTLLMVISTGLKILYSFLYRKNSNYVYLWTSFFTLPLLLVASQHDLFFILWLVLVLGLYSTCERKHVTFCLLNLANCWIDFLYRVRERNLVSFFYVRKSSFTDVIWWRECLFSQRMFLPSLLKNQIAVAVWPYF